MCHDIVIKSAFNDDYNMLHKSNLVTYQVLRQIRSYTGKSPNLLNGFPNIL